ncbi:hypothetical protein DDI_4247 [Dickeya dianthicola RNS04.9]|nr:hypothetical protein DDI_4247 [Dickeya dianthicola RNS04.9]
MFSPSLFVIDRRIMSKNETLFLLYASQTVAFFSAWIGS